MKDSAPSSRCFTSIWWIYSMAPTSGPGRLHCQKDIVVLNLLPRLPSCWLPPDMLRVTVPPSPLRDIKSSAGPHICMSHLIAKPPSGTRSKYCCRTELYAGYNPSTRPCCCPRDVTRRVPVPCLRHISPFNRMAEQYKPGDGMTSVCPLPSIPQYRPSHRCTSKHR